MVDAALIESLSQPVSIALMVLLIIALLAWLVTYHNQQKQIESLEQEGERFRVSCQALEAEFADQRVAHATLTERIEQLDRQLADERMQVIGKDQSIAQINAELIRHLSHIAELETTLDKERQAAEEKLALLEDAKAKMSSEFKLLANEIFEERGKAFSVKNQASLDEVLKPMREQLGEFRKRVDEVHLNDSKDRASLKEHLSHLEKLNRQMSEDALNLTQALKGDSKAQGNWGEMILERLLESTGLREGHEFIREQSFADEEGRRFRPDVVIYMPGDKQVIVDSKVSLTDYEQAISAEDTSTRDIAVKAHLRSLKDHIKALSSKRYDHLPNVNSPDYVLMFVPIEGAYLMAIEADQSIFESAFEQRVAVVTPSTLYATLKLIEQLWRSERQSENVVHLIDRASKLHDKMVDFISAFEDVGQRLDQAQDAYAKAHNRIKSGRGNVLSQIATLGTLAGKTKKELPTHLVESAALQDQTEDKT
ncbi:DNA recombination protein RmuC [Mariprofundus micogutta]|uniref:DNA recombination protein RmuC n=1 Tax=Mariprofundus micogutta TaxID=1921010 RepID=A0A1L8CNC2_9PROT|nr:DNA recombination protein RmuC [Mariprofundus micogutta]GAV20415.1 DNA recombination protein RmuC [Mariprofundus micogutta]